MNPFELTLSVPSDERYGAVLLALASHAAQHAGCNAAAAAEFVAAVDDAWQGCVRSRSASQSGIAIVLRQQDNELEATFTCGRTVRVARALPPAE